MQSICVYTYEGDGISLQNKHSPADLTVFSSTFLLLCVMQRYGAIMNHDIISIQFFEVF